MVSIACAPSLLGPNFLGCTVVCACLVGVLWGLSAQLALELVEFMGRDRLLKQKYLIGLSRVRDL
jgi:hypothetical protein